MLEAANAPLQQRTVILNLDASRANRLPDDYDTNLESDWGNPSTFRFSPFLLCSHSLSLRCLDLFADGDDFSWQTIERGRNQYYQRQLSEQIQTKASATLDLLSSALKIHLNVGQNMTMNTSSLFMSMETVTVKALSTRTVYQSGGARIQMPPTLRLDANNQTSISLRVRF